MDKNTLDEGKVLRIVARFGMCSKSDIRSEIQVSDLDTVYGEVTDELYYLYSSGLLNVSPQEDWNEIISLKDKYIGAAERIDTALHLEYNGNAERMAENEDLSDFIDEPLADTLDEPEELQKKDYPEISMTVDNNSYALAIYPFGNASLHGNSRRELKPSAVENVTKKDLSRQLELLEATGYLESVYREENDQHYFRLPEDYRVQKGAKSVAALLNSRYDMNFKRFYTENDRDFF